MITTTATNKKVREILKSVRDGSLISQPDFQRRLVWTSKDKDKFIESVVKGYPFPEIYFCNGEVDTDTGEGTQLLVDGQQRVNTLTEYFEGNIDFTHVLTIPYTELSKQDKEKFLDYNVVVRDLGNLSKEQITEVFKRLNSTQYTLRVMEINNAIYDGALKKFCEEISENSFFDEHRVFSTGDRRRMGDVSFCLSLLGTMMLGYFNRDSEHEFLLSKFNEYFPYYDEYQDRIQKTLNFIDECGFENNSRIWKKADFFTAFIEIEHSINTEGNRLSPYNVITTLSNFYDLVDNSADERPSVAEIYYKSALQASNDKNSRARRGIIASNTIHCIDEEKTLKELNDKSLI